MSVLFADPKYWSVPEMWQGLSKNLKDVNWVKLEKSWMKILPKSFLLPVFLTIIFWIECKLWGQEVGVVVLNYSLPSFYRRVRLFSLILGPLNSGASFFFGIRWPENLSHHHPGECLTASNSWATQVDLDKTREGSPLYLCWKEDNNYLWDLIF